MHRIEQIFALRVDAHPELLAFAAKAFLKFNRRGLRACSISDDHHRKFSLHNRLVDIDDAAICFGEDLRDTRNYSRMIDAKHRDYQPVSGTRALGLPKVCRLRNGGSSSRAV